LRSSRTRIFASILGLIALVVAACGSSSSPSGKSTPSNGYDYSYTYQNPTKTGGKLVYTDFQSPDSANIISSTLDPTVINVNVLSAMWGSCIVQLPDLSLKLNGWKPDECTQVPTVANGGESADAKTTTMKIDPKMKWSDGQPLVAADFLFWYQMFADNNIGGAKNSPPWDTATVTSPDAQTVVINWGKPYAPYLFNLLAAEPSHLYPAVYSAGGVYDTKAAVKLINNTDFLNKPVVNGPYMPQTFGSLGSTVVMVPNPNYVSNFFHKPALDQLIFSQAGSKDAEIQGFKAGGQYDQADDFTVADLPKFNDIDPSQVIQSPAYEFEHFELDQRPESPNAKLNGGASIFADKAVRQAFIEGFNKCAIITGILGQACDNPTYTTNEITAPIDPAYDPSVKLPAFDPKKAAADLDAAGYKLDAGGKRTFKDGKTEITLRVVTTRGNLVRNSTLALLQQQWQSNLGVTLNIVEDPAIFDSFDNGGFLATGNFDVALFAFSSAANADGLTGLITSTAIPSKTNKAGQNYSGINDPSFTTSLDQARQESDPVKALAEYHDIYAKVTEDSDMFPLYARPNISLVDSAVGNYKQHPASSGNMWNIGEWFSKN